MAYDIGFALLLSALVTESDLRGVRDLGGLGRI